MIGWLLLIIFVLIIFDRDDTPRSRGGRGGGYQPRYREDGIHQIVPPGHKPTGAAARYILSGARFPWDQRPSWLWTEMWTLAQLPDNKWGNKMREEIEDRFLQYRPDPPAPMRAAVVKRATKTRRRRPY